jgi:hypothetical protein
MLRPEWESAKPPFKPKAINKYKDRKREIAGGISKLDLAVPASTPKIKNRMAGSSRFCIFFIPSSILGFSSCFVKSILKTYK